MINRDKMRGKDGIALPIIVGLIVAIAIVVFLAVT